MGEAVSNSRNTTEVGSAGIVAHYRAKGYQKAELRRMVERHVRLLRPLDPEAAEYLEGAVLADDARERLRRQTNEYRRAFARRRAANPVVKAHAAHRKQVNEWRRKKP